MNGYEEKIKDRLFLEVCNAAGREEWDGLAHQQKENLMLVCRLSGYDEKFQRDCGLVTREQMEHWGIEEEVLFRMHGQICLQNVRRSLWILRMPTGITMTRISFRWRKTGENLEDGCRFYVLTNNMDHGAVYMMDEATLQKSAENWTQISSSFRHPSTKCISW